MANAVALGRVPRAERSGSGWKNARSRRPWQSLRMPRTATNRRYRSRDAHTTAHPGIRYRLEVADQVEIGCSRVALEHREEAIPSTSTHADSTGKNTGDSLNQPCCGGHVEQPPAKTRAINSAVG